MNILTLMLIGWAVMAAMMLGLWIVQRATHNAGIVDVAWSFGTGLLGAWFAWGVDGDVTRRILVGTLAGVWGIRLGVYLVKRMMSESEDGRYKMLREKWGEQTQRNLFWFFQIQAAWAIMFAMPMLIAAANPSPAGWLDGAAVALWILAIGGEMVADAQLARFRRDDSNKGKVCQVGLWRYSRHPNYFFEWVHWWAYVLFSVGYAWGWLSLLGPAVMLVFLLYVTGVPLTEKRSLASRGEAYREYQRTTNRFFPGPRQEATT